MEMYAVSGLCASYDNPGAREERTRTLRWLETLGLSVTTLVYRNNGTLFMLPTADEEEDTAAYQMCVDPALYLQGVNTTAFGGDEDAICYRSGQTFDVLTANVTILELLRDIQRSVEQIKRAAFFVMSPFRRRTGRRMRDYFAVAGSLGWQATVFSGLETDLQFVASKLKADLEPIKDLKPTILWSDESLPGTLQDRLMDSMNRHLDVLGKHITQIQRAFGEHLVVRNMDAMYLLQRWVVVLTVVVTVATIVGAYFGWQATLKSGP
jgi:hypothetical protein